MNPAIVWATLAGAVVTAAGIAAEPTDDEMVDATPSALETALQEDHEEGPRPLASEFSDAYVTLAVVPRYPKRALKRELDGQVTLGFDISRHGRARNIDIVEQSPTGVFDDEALDAMKYWAFSPARLALCGTAVQKAKQTIVFDHDGDPQIRLLPLVVNDIPQLPRPIKQSTLQEYLRDKEATQNVTFVSETRDFRPVKRVQPEFPSGALERRKEGMVALFFLIDANGNIDNVKIVDAVNGPLFGRPSLQAIRQWEFEPRTKDGRPVESTACHEFIFHADEYRRSGKLARQREAANIRSYGVQ